MAPEKRLPADLLATAARLTASANRVSFFPLIHFLERLTSGTARVGDAGPASEEGIRFRHDPSLTFSASDVTALTLREQPVHPGDPFSPKQPVFEVMTTFLGLTGSVTPLPFYMAEEVVREEGEATSPQRDFLDLFHHRLISLFFRVRGRYDLATEHTADGSDRWSKRILALAGVTGDEPPSPALPASRLLRLSPLLAGRARTARTLELALEDVLREELAGAPAKVVQFVGTWTDIDRPQRSQLGLLNTSIGQDFVLGSRIFYRSGKFQIRLGPLSEPTYKRLLPDGDLNKVVRDVVEMFTRDPLEYALELILAKASGRGFVVGGETPARLGQDTWLATSQTGEKRVKVGEQRFSAGPR